MEETNSTDTQGQKRKIDEVGPAQAQNPSSEEERRTEDMEGDDDEIDLAAFLEAQQIDPEYERYGKAVVLKGLRWNKLTALEIIYAGLSKITPGKWNHDTVHIVTSDTEFKLFIQEGCCNLDKFRGKQCEDYKFLSVTGEVIYKFAYTFYRQDGQDISSQDEGQCLTAMKKYYPKMVDHLSTFAGWSPKFVSVNISHPDKKIIYDLLTKIRELERLGTGKISAGHLLGDPMRCSFYTTDTNYKQYIFGKIGKDRDFRTKHEDGIFKYAKMNRMMAYAPKQSMIQKVPSLYYHAWLDQKGYEAFMTLVNKGQSFYITPKIREPVTLRAHEKRAFENKSGYDDKKSAYGSGYFRYGESQRD